MARRAPFPSFSPAQLFSRLPGRALALCLAVPFFKEAARNFLGLEWSSLYAIGYAGAGNVGDGTRVYGAFDEYRLDVGAGVEASLAYRKTQAFLSALAAKTVFHGIGDFRFLLTLRSYRRRRDPLQPPGAQRCLAVSLFWLILLGISVFPVSVRKEIP